MKSSGSRTMEIPDDPVSVWIERLKVGESNAAQPLWEHFFGRLYAVAKKKMANLDRRIYDEEDAAQSGDWMKTRS